jgi:hypothetical protein
VASLHVRCSAKCNRTTPLLHRWFTDATLGGWLPLGGLILDPMKPARFHRLIAIVALLAVLPCAQAQTRSTNSRPAAGTEVETAFQTFWAANSPAEAELLAERVEETGVTFDEALRRLKLGRTYPAQETGVVQLKNRTEDGIEHFYAVNIPSTYDPLRRYQVRFQLHGGIFGRTDNQPRGTGEIGALAGVDQIYVLPYAWHEAPWWATTRSSI